MRHTYIAHLFISRRALLWLKLEPSETVKRWLGSVGNRGWIEGITIRLRVPCRKLPVLA